jgi:hypothetical protein
MHNFSATVALLNRDTPFQVLINHWLRRATIFIIEERVYVTSSYRAKKRYLPI